MAGKQISLKQLLYTVCIATFITCIVGFIGWAPNFQKYFVDYSDPDLVRKNSKIALQDERIKIIGNACEIRVTLFRLNSCQKKDDSSKAKFTYIDLSEVRNIEVGAGGSIKFDLYKLSEKAHIRKVKLMSSLSKEHPTSKRLQGEDRSIFLSELFEKQGGRRDLKFYSERHLCNQKIVIRPPLFNTVRIVTAEPRNLPGTLQELHKNCS